MTVGLLFWVLMLFWAIYGFAWGWPWRDAASRPIFGSWVILFVLIGVLGWRVFGPALNG
jgi:hypothetical protein